MVEKNLGLRPSCCVRQVLRALCLTQLVSATGFETTSLVAAKRALGIAKQVTAA